MEILDFCFVGHVMMGPRIINKLVEKGVKRPSNVTGDNSKYVYYVAKSKSNYEMDCSGVDSSFGKHILSTREQVTVDKFQSFLQQLAGVVLPEEPKKRAYNRFPVSKEQRLIDLCKMGNSVKECAKIMDIDELVIRNKVQYLRKQGKIPPAQEVVKIAEQKAKDRKRKVSIPDTEIKQRVDVASKLAAAMLVMGIDFQDEQLAKRAVNITDKIFELYK